MNTYCSECRRSLGLAAVNIELFFMSYYGNNERPAAQTDRRGERRGGGRGIGERHRNYLNLDSRERSRHAQSQVMEQNLNAAIGMSTARDPMTSSGGGLILKHSGQRSMVINGYALLPDDDDDPPPTKMTATNNPALFQRGDDVPAPPTRPSAASFSAAVPQLPLGRGRGTALPAWMTAPSRDVGTLTKRTGRGRDEAGGKTKSPRREERNKEWKMSRRHDYDDQEHRKHRPKHGKKRRRRSPSSEQSLAPSSSSSSNHCRVLKTIADVPDHLHVETCSKKSSTSRDLLSSDDLTSFGNHPRERKRTTFRKGKRHCR